MGDETDSGNGNNTFWVETRSLEDNANVLVETAGLLQAGRPELALSEHARAPWAQDEVAREVSDFAAFAHDQYEDVVAILAALSTRLRAAAGMYHRMDRASADRMDDFLLNSRFQPADQRR